MKRIALSVVAIFVQNVSKAQACAVCIGKDNEGYLQSIMVPIAIFLVTPFIIFMTAIFFYRRLSGKQHVSKKL